MNRPFIKGLDLSELLYEEAVKPILATHFPGLPYSAALLRYGSDVLGFDTPQSRDHDWGPRVMLFLTEGDYETHRDRMDQVLRQELPSEVHGYSTDFGRHEDGTAVMAATDGGLGSRESLPARTINHGVMFFTVRAFFNDVLRLDPDEELRANDWLTLPEQCLRSVTSGRVFHDGLGRLEPIRACLRYYPHDVWSV